MNTKLPITLIKGYCQLGDHEAEETLFTVICKGEDQLKWGWLRVCLDHYVHARNQRFPVSPVERYVVDNFVVSLN